MPVQDINKEELRSLIKNEKDKLQIIDVRTPEEFRNVHIKGSKLIPLNELASRLDEINWEKKVIFICHSGNRSKFAANMYGADKNLMNLKYGIYECYSDGHGDNLEFGDDN